MKIKQDFITNSSSSSFIIGLSDKYVPFELNQLLMKAMEKTLVYFRNNVEYLNTHNLTDILDLISLPDTLALQKIYMLVVDFLHEELYSVKIKEWNVYSAEIENYTMSVAEKVFLFLEEIDSENFVFKRN